MDVAVNRSRMVKEVVNHLETYYNAQLVTKPKEEMTRLSPDVEQFLKKMEKRFRLGQSV